MFKKIAIISVLSVSCLAITAHAGTPIEELTEDTSLRKTLSNDQARGPFTVAVIDSGFHHEHELFAKNTFLEGWNIRDKNPNTGMKPYIDVLNNPEKQGKTPSIHGTHVAGIFHQLNRNVKIIPVKMGSDYNPRAVVDALKWLKNQKFDAVNISDRVLRNTPEDTEYATDERFDIIKEIAKESFVILAAGNGSRELQDLPLKSQNNKLLSEYFEELNGRVILVGATEKIRNKKNEVIEKMTSYSNRPCKTLEKFFISVPGEDIKSAVVDLKNKSKTAEFGGTSMASPLFMGAMVRLANEFGCSLDFAKEVLFQTAIKESGIKRSDGIFTNPSNTGSGIMDFGAAWRFLELMWHDKAYCYNENDQRLFITKPEDSYKLNNPTKEELTNHIEALSKLYTPNWVSKYDIITVGNTNPFQDLLKKFPEEQLKIFSMNLNSRERINKIISMNIPTWNELLEQSQTAIIKADTSYTLKATRLMDLVKWTIESNEDASWLIERLNYACYEQNLFSKDENKKMVDFIKKNFPTNGKPVVNQQPPVANQLQPTTITRQNALKLAIKIPTVK